MPPARRVRVSAASLATSGAALLLSVIVAAAGPIGPERQAGDTAPRLIAERDAGCPDGRGGRLVARNECADEYCDTVRLVLVRLDGDGFEVSKSVVNDEEDSYSWSPAAVACGPEPRVTVAWRLSGCPLVRDFDLDGRAMSDPIQVGTDCHRWWHEIRATIDGRFVALTNGQSYDVAGQHHFLELDVFDRSGRVLAWSLQATDELPGHFYSDFDVAADGTMLIAWQIYDQPAVFARALDPMAQPIGDAERIDVDPYGHPSQPKVVALADGSFHVFWSSSVRGGWVGRRFVVDDTTVTTTTSTSTTTTFPVVDIPEIRNSVNTPAEGWAVDLAGAESAWAALVTYGKGVRLARSTDGGRSWSDSGELAYARWSALESSGNTWLLALMDDDYSECDVRFLRSTDHGESWNDFVYRPRDYDVECSGQRSGVTLAAGGDGGWLVGWAAEQSYGEPTERLGWIKVARSNDDAASWSEAIPVATLVGTYLSTPTLASDQEGQWLVGWSQTERIGLSASIRVARSWDDAASWSAPSLVAETPGEIPSLQLAAIGGGTWIAAWVNGSPQAGFGYDSDIMVATSSDGGASWSEPTAVAPFAPRDEASDDSPRLAVAGDGRVLLAWTSYFDLGGAIGTDGDLLAVVSDDRGQTWSGPRPLLAAATDDPYGDLLVGLAHVRDDVWAALWRTHHLEDGAYRVRFGRTFDVACGNGQLDNDELCDDGNGHDGDGCDSNCAPTGCGNGVVTAGEECDDGNQSDFDECTTICLANRCGDGFANGGREQCDDGNGDDHDACRNDCTLAWCGDGIVWHGVEECDDGNYDETDGCAPNCTIPRCGNGYIEPGEECDDGNESDRDECLTICRYNRCGDGFRNRQYGEECDDGNLIDGDGCDSTCRPTGCGSGAVSGAEECDDGNSDESDDCLNDCTLGRCGDGILRSFDNYGYTEPAELCDDGNLIDGDGCDSTCRPTGCGSGVVTGDEECDDGNDSDFDDCTSECLIAYCGDGAVHASVEECDDGNAVDGDGCSSSCTYEGECGDANLDGRVTATDARHVLRHAIGALVECPSEICDVDASGLVDTSDALGTLRYAVGLYDASICERPVRLVARLLDPVTLGALQIRVDYAGVPGAFVGVNDRVECTTLVSDGFPVFAHHPHEAALRAGFISVAGFRGPTDLFSCIFLRHGPRSTLQFSVTVEDATDPELIPVENAQVVVEQR